VLVLRIQDVNSVLIWATLVLFVVSGGILVVVAGDKMAKSAAELVEEENSKEKNENTG
jgi:cytochrome c-type biogenesis protein CcmH/NrfF